MDAVISALFRLVEQEAQGLQVFAFSVVTVNAEHTKSRFKRRRMG